MKFASLNNGHPDGELLLVSYDGLSDQYIGIKAGMSFQYFLDHWSRLRPKMEAEYQQLLSGKHPEQLVFNSTDLLSPLPRAYQWLDASAYVNHVELVRKARGVKMPDSFWTDPLMYQGASDGFLAPNEDIPVEDEARGLDFESEIAVVTGGVPQGVKAAEAGQYIRVFMLVNDLSLRNLIPAELAKGFGFIHGKPASSFSPMAITPDELGVAWDGGKVRLNLHSYLNDNLFGQPNAGTDMTFDFPTLIAHAAKTRVLAPGTIIGSGTVSNRNREAGSSCIVEKRMLEILDGGQAETPYLRRGDEIKIVMLDAKGNNLFGNIQQKVTSLKGD